jgi:hypothetical protein
VEAIEITPEIQDAADGLAARLAVFVSEHDALPFRFDPREGAAR